MNASWIYLKEYFSYAAELIFFYSYHRLLQLIKVETYYVIHNF